MIFFLDSYKMVQILFRESTNLKLITDTKRYSHKTEN